MTDIFKDAKEKVMPTWASFKEAGDSVQGTYVGKILGQKDGYGNEQVIYQLLQDDDTVVNVGFGLNKKFIIQDMDTVGFGQIVGFKFKGKIQVKDKFGKPVEVKDFGLHQDSKITNEAWLKENKDNMPTVVRVQATAESEAIDQSKIDAEKQFADDDETDKKKEDVPFSSEGSLTEEDKLKAIEKLAKDKLGTINLETAKATIMDTMNIAFIPINYDQIIEKLTAM